MGGRVDGKMALVTGAASGIGKATAELLAAEGAQVTVADINEAAGRAVAESLGGRGHFVKLDVTDEAAWQAAVAEAADAMGGLDILVNNAGISINDTIASATYAMWQRTHQVCLDSVFLGCHTAIPVMAETTARGAKGAIVNISSVAGLLGVERLMSYSSAKAGVRNVTKSIALHCARKGYDIRCNSVHPGSVDTPILDPDREKFGAEKTLAVRAAMIPLGRVGKAEELAKAVLFLASDDASFITGAELVVDGGFSCR